MKFKPGLKLAREFAELCKSSHEKRNVGAADRALFWTVS